MTPVLFIVLAIFYNLFIRLRREKKNILSVIENKNSSKINELLLHHFWIYVLECYLGLIVGLWLGNYSELYLPEAIFYIITLTLFCFVTFQLFLKHFEKKSTFKILTNFNLGFRKDFRFTIAVLLVPVFIFSTLSLAFNDFQEWGYLIFIGVALNVIFISVLSIYLSVVLMLMLIPHQEIVEDEYLDLIKSRLKETELESLRFKWIDLPIHNAFVVGMSLFKFSNQTLFIGKGLKEKLTLEEFDAVICHELSHIINKHIQKRILNVVKLIYLLIVGMFLAVILSSILILPFVFIYYDPFSSPLNWLKYTLPFNIFFIGIWFAICYFWFFKQIRSQELEADAYATIHLHVPSHLLYQAISKLEKHQPKVNKRSVFYKLKKYFSTHPEKSLRQKILNFKIKKNLPYDWSEDKSWWRVVANILKPKIIIPTLSLIVSVFSYFSYHLYHFQQQLNKIQHFSVNEIQNDSEIHKYFKMNYFKYLEEKITQEIIKKSDKELTTYFIQHFDRPRIFILSALKLKRYELSEELLKTHSNKITTTDLRILIKECINSNNIHCIEILSSLQQYAYLDKIEHEKIKSFFKKPALESRSPASENSQEKLVPQL